MSIEKITYVHEFLCRFDRTGFKAAHIGRAQDLEEDGVLMAGKTTLLDPQPVTADDATTLAQISDVINAAALVEIEGKAAQIVTLTADKQTAEAARDTALAQVETLTAQLAALQPVINGVPQFVKKWQLWAGLRMDDPSLALYNAVKAYTASFTGALKDLWDDSTGVERTAPALAGFKAGFGKTEADLDDMFTRYAAITQADVVALG